jgi:microcystin-dependent protein
MAYTINNYDGTLLTTITDGTIDATTSLELPGPNYVGYGKFLNENLVYLLQSFAGNTAPSGQNLQGQLWFNKSTQTLNVFGTQGYLPVSGIIVSSLQPLTANPGNTWFNTVTNQYSLYDGTNWHLIGPQYTKAQGLSGAIPVTVLDATNVAHNIIQIQYGNVVVATLSPDSAFSPSPGMQGFSTINPGITLNSIIPNPTFNSNVVGTLTGNVIGSIAGLRVDTATVAATTITGTLTGNTTSINSQITNLTASNTLLTNLSTANAQITGGNLTNIGTISANTETVGTSVITNFSTGNAQITSGNVTGINRLVATTSSIGIEVVTNFSTANAQIANAGITTLVATNLSTGNANIGNASVTTLVATNFSSGNVTGTFNGAFTGTVAATTTTPATSSNTTALATTAFVHNVLPTGVIVMWGGAVNSIPTGWALCNGSNGTPDLRDRFIVGAGSTYNPGATGGATTQTLTTTQLPAHTHTVTGTGSSSTTGAAGGHTHTASSTVTDTGHNHTFSDPGHSHNITDPTHAHVMPGDDQLSYAAGIGGWLGQSVGGFAYDAISNLGGGGTLWRTSYSGTGVSFNAATTGAHLVAATTGVTVATTVSTVSDHTHSVNVSITGTTSSSGSGAAFSILPLYYALCYIQKVY